MINDNAKLESKDDLEGRILGFYRTLIRHINDLETFQVKEDFKDTKYWLEYYKLYMNIKPIDN